MQNSLVGPQVFKANSVRSGSTLPSSPAAGDVFEKTSGGNEGFYAAASAGVWSGPFGTGSGTVTSVDASGGTETTTGSPITTTGTIRSSELVNARGTAASYTIADSDRGKAITSTRASAVAFTLPQAGTAGAFASGWWCDVVKPGGAGVITITPTVSTINNGLSSLTVSQGQSVRIISDGTNYQVAALTVPYLAASTLWGRGSAGGTGFGEPIALGANLTMSGTTLVGSGISGTGTENTLAKFGAGGTSVGNSQITDDGTDIAASTPGSVLLTSTNGQHVTLGAGTNTVDVDGANDQVTITGLLAFTAAASTESLAIDGVAHTATLTAATSAGFVSPILKLSTTSDLTATPTINTPSGIVRIAAAASTVTVTVTGMTSAWTVQATVRSNDTTLKTVSALPGSGSVVLTGNAAATGNTDVQILVLAPN